MADPRPFWERLLETWPAKAAKSAYHGAMLPGMLASGELEVKPSVPGQWSDVDEATRQATQGEVANRTTDLADLAMTGGVGTPGVSLASGFTLRPPKALAGYHGTTAPELFSKFKTSDKDIGVHFTTNPNLAAEYSIGDISPFAYGGAHGGMFSSPEKWPEHVVVAAKQEHEALAGRTYPVVADVNKALKLPLDPGGNWSYPEGLLQSMAARAQYDDAFRFPKGILRDLEEADKASGGWHKNLVPMLQDRGYDAVKYPHMETPNTRGGGDRYNSYMIMDPNKIAPRFSPEGQEIIARRGGVIRPYQKKLYLEPDDYSEEFLWPYLSNKPKEKLEIPEPWNVWKPPK